MDTKEVKLGLLGALLMLIQQTDALKEYDARNAIIVAALGSATDLGYATGFRIDPAEPEWPVVFIELPEGQISYHLPQHVLPWDGHTIAEKNIRITQFIAKSQPMASLFVSQLAAR